MSKSRQRNISPERKGLYYIGIIISIIGFVLFFSIFVTFLTHFGDFNNFTSNARSGFGRAILGLIFVIVGRFLMKIGFVGLAGSGVVLDPEMARQDIEPWSRMAGGMIQDAVSEIDEVKKITNRTEASTVTVKVRCSKCRTLNDESAKFCNECGSPL